MLAHDAAIELFNHVAQNTSERHSAVPDAIAQTDGYAVSQQKRKLIDQGFGWVKLAAPAQSVFQQPANADFTDRAQA